MDMDKSLKEVKELVLKNLYESNKDIYLFYKEFLKSLSKQKNEGPIGREHPYSNLIKEFTVLDDKDMFKVLYSAWIEGVKKESIGQLWLPEKIAVFIIDIIEEFNLESDINFLFPNFSFVLSSYLALKDNYNIVAYEINNDLCNIAEKIYELCNINTIEIRNENFIDNNCKRDKGIIFSLVPFIKKYIDKDRLSNIKGFSLPGRLDYISAYIIKSLNYLRKDGYAIYMLPLGFLENDKYRPIREYINTKYRIISVIEMPYKGMFANSTIKTALLIVQNSKKDPEDVLLASFEDQDFNKEKVNYIKYLRQHLGEESIR